MAWIAQQDRLTQCFVYTTAALNSCGIRPDGAEIRQWILEELPTIATPSPEEVDVVLAGFVAEGVKFHGDPGSLDKFMVHPLLGARGHRLGAIPA